MSTPADPPRHAAPVTRERTGPDAHHPATASSTPDPVPDERADHLDPRAAVYPAEARLPGAARSGRDRPHEFPGRRQRIAPSFTANEYATVASAAARVGLTPTGFCATAAVAMAKSTLAGAPTAADGKTVTVAVPALDGARVEALAATQAELADLRTAVVRVGTNLNQAVAALHATGEAPTWLRRVVELCGHALRAVDEAASRVHRRLS